MREHELEQAIASFFEEAFQIDPPAPETNLIETGILDSLMVVDLVLFIEQRFGVTTAIEDLDLENFATIERMARFVAARRDPAEPVRLRSGERR